VISIDSAGAPRATKDLTTRGRLCSPTGRHCSDGAAWLWCLGHGITDCCFRLPLVPALGIRWRRGTEGGWSDVLDQVVMYVVGVRRPPTAVISARVHSWWWWWWAGCAGLFQLMVTFYFPVLLHQQHVDFFFAYKCGCCHVVTVVWPASSSVWAGVYDLSRCSRWSLTTLPISPCRCCKAAGWGTCRPRQVPARVVLGHVLCGVTT